MINKVYRLLQFSSLVGLIIASSNQCMKKSYGTWKRLIPYASKTSPSLALRKSLFRPHTDIPFITSLTKRYYAIPKYSKEKSTKYESLISWYFQDDTKQKLNEQSKLIELQSLASFFPTETIQAFLKAPEKNQAAFLTIVQSNAPLKSALSEAAIEQKDQLSKYGDGKKLLTTIIDKEHLSSEIPEYKTYAAYQKTMDSSSFSQSSKEYNDKQEEKTKTYEQELRKRPETIEDFLNKLNRATRYQNFIPSAWITYIIKKFPHEADKIKEATYNSLLDYITQWSGNSIKSTVSRDPKLGSYILNSIIEDPKKLFATVKDISAIYVILDAIRTPYTTFTMASFIADNIQNLMEPYYLHHAIEKIIKDTPISSTQKEVKEIFIKALTNDAVIDAILTEKNGAPYLTMIVQNIALSTNPALNSAILKGINRNLKSIFTRTTDKEDIYSLLSAIINTETALSIASLIADNIQYLIIPEKIYSITKKIIKNLPSSSHKEAQGLIASALTPRVMDTMLNQPDGLFYSIQLFNHLYDAAPLVDYFKANDTITKIINHRDFKDFINSFSHLKSFKLSSLEKLEFHKLALQHEKKLKKTKNGNILLAMLKTEGAYERLKNFFLRKLYTLKTKK